MLFSIIAGAMFVPFTMFEMIYWFFLFWRGKHEGYPAVRDIWSDRSCLELLGYTFGLLAFLSWPIVPSFYEIGNRDVLRIIACVQWFLFVIITMLTLTVPIGLRRRYRWLSSQQYTGYERLFVGQVPASIFLRSSKTGSEALLKEFISILVVLVLAPAMVNYATWLSLEKTAYNIPTEVLNSEISILDFIYQSVVTITTTGFGDITPKESSAQFISVSQISLGWMYIVATFPLLLSTLQRSARQEVYWRKRASYRGGLLGSVIRAGLYSLRENCSAVGSWEACLSSDAVAMYFARQTLELAQRDLPISQSLISNLDIHCSSKGSQPEGDGTIHVLSELQSYNLDSSWENKKEELISTLRSDLSLKESGEGFIRWIGLVLFEERLTDCDPVLFSVEPPSIEDWLKQYGKHWATYAIVANLLHAQYTGDESAAGTYAIALTQLRSDTGSWFGDCLLTALCALALAKTDRQQTVWHSAAIWIADVVKAYSTVSLVRNLDVWHTGLALEVLHVGGVRAERALQWLIEHSLDTLGGGGWSWSSESNALCLDSTSTVVHAISALDVRDVHVKRCLEAAQIALKSALKETDQGEWSIPTFIDSDWMIEPCPIIAARSLRVVEMPAHKRLSYAKKLVGQVKSGSASPWFSQPSITRGLVLWYLSPFLPFNYSDVRHISGELVRDASRITERDNVVRACILLGLLACLRIIDADAEMTRTVERLVDRVIASQERGRWIGEPVGIFGFGRLYSDDHLASVLSLYALMEYAAS